MTKIEDPSLKTHEEHDKKSKGSRIIGLISIVIGLFSVVLSQTYYIDNLTFLFGGIFLIIIGSLSVLFS